MQKKIYLNGYYQYLFISLTFGLIAFQNQKVKAQGTYRFPFVTINPSASSGGMGETGVATLPDNSNSIFFNPSKLSFIEAETGLSLSYIPYFASASNFYLIYLSFHKKINKNQTFGYSLRYNNNGGSTILRNNIGQQTGIAQPVEASTNLAYAIQVRDNLSLSVDLGLIYADIFSPTNSGSFIKSRDLSAILGISMYFVGNDFQIEDWNIKPSLGISISNLGLSTPDRGYLPANFKIGYALEGVKEDIHKLIFAADVSKFLVPSTLDTNVPNPSGFEVLYESFSDAPGGFREELQEITLNTGLNYIYNDIFSLRAGYVGQSKRKTAGSYATLGIGFIFYVVSIDLSYIIAPKNEFVNNSFKFSLAFNIDQKFESKERTSFISNK